MEIGGGRRISTWGFFSSVDELITHIKAMSDRDFLGFGP